MKEICREKSQRGKTQQVLAVLVLIAIGCSWYYDANMIKNGEGLNPVYLFLNFVWLGFWIWKTCFRYEIILRQKELEIITTGFYFIKHSYTVDLNTVVGIVPKYEHNFFKKTGIKHYIHRFSMIDPNPTRMVTFLEGEKKSMAGVIFCCSDYFLGELRKLRPDQYLGF